MSLLGTNLSLMLGPTVPAPVPAPLMQALQSVQVTASDGQSMGFSLSFNAEPGKGGLAVSALKTLLLKPFNRAVVTVLMNGVPTVLMDGIITHEQLTPSDGSQGSLFTVMGMDVSIMMDLHEQSIEHPSQDAEMIAELIIGEYAVYGMIPTIIPTDLAIPPLPVDRVPIQDGTDRGYLEQLAGMFGYVFYVRPGPAPLSNVAYWGPPIRAGVPQPALTVNMGPATNVASMDFSYDALTPTTVKGAVLDMETNLVMPVRGAVSLRVPPLATLPALVANMPHTRSVLLRHPGLNELQAESLAEGLVSQSTDAVVTVNGSVDSFRYGHVLTPRGLVGVRGAGYGYDGLYYVKSVTHDISVGEYRQTFILNREGLGSTVPAVVP